VGIVARIIRQTLAYIIEYSPDAGEHLKALSARQQRIVIDTVDRQLIHEPTIETKNRKPMRPNPLAPWELRIGTLRVYYDVEEEPTPTVLVLAVGVKERSQVRIGGQVVDL
jgi:mRNA-degrading endonuclease RelE of RelBE toxin-antitoxin system